VLEFFARQGKKVDRSVLERGSGENEEQDGAMGQGGLKVGTRVRHAKYGQGLIVRREGDGENAKLTINFPGYGQKKMIEKYAALEIIK
jgi:DNA helicase II / ATP-dependent DNA helicase PcrA